MKKTILIMSLLLSSVSFANRESGGRLAPLGLYVVFGSFGTGIDQATKEVFEVLLEEAKARGEVSDVIHSQQGREGETQYCVLFNHFGPKHQFQKALGPAIRSDIKKVQKQRTAVLVALDCSDIQKAQPVDPDLL